MCVEFAYNLWFFWCPAKTFRLMLTGTACPCTSIEGWIYMNDCCCIIRNNKRHPFLFGTVFLVSWCVRLLLCYKTVMSNSSFHLTGSAQTKLQGVCSAKPSYFCQVSAHFLCIGCLRLGSLFWLGKLLGMACSLTWTGGTNKGHLLRQLSS